MILLLLLKVKISQRGNHKGKIRQYKNQQFFSNPFHNCSIEHDIETVQKSAGKWILKEAYNDYESGFKMLNIESLVYYQKNAYRKIYEICNF